MMKIFGLILFLPFIFSAQSNDQNFILTKSYKQFTTTTIADLDEAHAFQEITYFDGLGRPKQKVNLRQGPSANDIVTPITYDFFGRQEFEYLPYFSSSNNGQYIENSIAITQMSDQYSQNLGQTVTFSQKDYEPSPLNRVCRQSAPGNDWAIGSGHEIKFDYHSNADNEVKLYVVTTTAPVNGIYNPTLTQTTYYSANDLYKTITKDENWTSGKNHTTEEFKDKQGRVILKRNYSDYRTADGLLISTEVAHDTYYVYDQYGNLTYVIPPLVTNALDQTQRDNLCYQYKYDHRNRLVEKKLPGKQPEFIVFDKLDRIVATGPAFSPFWNSVAPNNIGWLVTKYDIFNRPIITGWMAASNANTSAARHTLQTARNGDVVLSESKSATANTINNVATRYTTVAWPTGTTAYHILTVNYYDDYDSGVTFSPAISYSMPLVSPEPIYYNNSTIKPKGLPTVSLIRVLQTTTLINFEKSYTLYDNKARPVRTFTNNHLGGYTQIDSQIDFAGRTLKTETYQKRLAADTELKIREWFTYSDQDRLMYHAHQVNNNAIELLVENSYNHIGMLSYKKVGNTVGSPLQKVDYNYNIRGWLTGINNSSGNMELNVSEKDLFAFKLNYNTVEAETNYTGTPLFNGNISESYWRTSADNIQRKYGYRYDNLNRLVEAIYQKPGTGVTNSYDERMAYDRNGNITGLVRFGDFDSPTQPLEIDRLSYAYEANSNRLRYVADTAGQYATPGFVDGTNTGDDYAYDANGNMITDLNKGINASGTTPIKYNHLNLPLEISINTSLPLSLNRKINYLYNAAGVKVQKIVTSGSVVTTIDYLNGFQYKNTALQFFPTAEGYVNFDSGVYKYVYNYLDHLGNVRLSYTSDPGAPNGLSIMEQNHYYPFGLKHTKYNIAVLKLRGSQPEVALVPEYKYKYNGKEFQDELGFNLYDYGARNYDPAIGRWMNIDPLAEVSRRWSPYTYCYNNPVNFVDPDGMWPDKPIVDNSSEGSYSDFMNGYDESIVLIGGAGSDPIDPPKPGQGTSTGNAQYVGENGLPNGIDLPATQLQEVVVGRNIESIDSYSSGGGVFESAGAIAITAAAVDGPIPIGDVIGAVVLAGATIYDSQERTFLTYTMTNGLGQTYVGRTSGYGDPNGIMMRRASGHHMGLFSFSNPVLDRAAQGYAGYPAIRGREQQLIDAHGGVNNLNVGNRIRGVSPINPAGRFYHEASNFYFGPLAPYTGY